MTAANRMFDVAIVGAGPAGTSSALALRKLAPEASILLLEAGNYPRHKVCGEFVSYEGLTILRSLDVLDGLAIGPAQRLNQARIFAAGTEISTPLDAEAAGFTRFRLDNALWQACKEAGIDCSAGVTVHSVENNGALLLRCSERDFSAKAVINATGRWSTLSKRNHSVSGHKWLGVKAHFAENNPSQSVDLYFFEHGYCGVQPIGPDRVNACALVRSDAATTLQEVCRLHPQLKERSLGWRLVIRPVSTAPIFFQEPRPVDRNMLCVGDAAGFIDPFVGDGITLALQGGGLAAQALVPFLRGDMFLQAAIEQYERAYNEALRPLFGCVAWLRKLLNLPKPVQRAAMAALRMPMVGRTLVRRTRAQM